MLAGLAGIKAAKLLIKKDEMIESQKIKALAEDENLAHAVTPAADERCVVTARASSGYGLFVVAAVAADA